MWAEKNVSLVDFFKIMLSSRYSTKYMYVVTIIARKGDYKEVYKEIKNNWKSFNDLSGENILILLASDEIKENHDELLKMICERKIVTNKDIPLVRFSDDYLALIQKGNNTYTNFENNHTDQIESLRKYFNLEESQLPGIMITSLITGENNYIKLIKKTKNELYPLIRNIKSNLFDDSKEINSFIKKYIEYKKQILSFKKTNENYISHTRKDLNNDLENIINNENNKELNNFFKYFLDLKYGEAPEYNKDEKVKQLKMIIKSSKKYQKIKKKLNKYYYIYKLEENIKEYDLVNYFEYTKNIDEYDSEFMKDLKNLEQITLKDSYNSGSLNNLGNIFTGKLNLGITKLDTKYIIKLLTSYF